MSANTDANKANAQAFYELMFNKSQPGEAIERYAGAVYIQHNPHVADGKAAVIAYFERMARDFPGAVAAVVLQDHQIIPGLSRGDAAAVIAPSYTLIGRAMPDRFAQGLAPDKSIVPYFAADVGLVLDRRAQINADPAHILQGMPDLDHVGVMGMSLGAIVTAQACALEPRIDACLMMDAPVPTEVASTGLRQAALWISRPAQDQRLERAASGGWPEIEISAQAATIDEALSHSEHGQLVMLQGLFHLDFTDLPAIQPIPGWLGQSGPAGGVAAQRQINQLTKEFFANAIGVPPR